MVIQHLVQPPKFRDIRRTIFENKFSSYLDQNNIDFDEIHISDEEYRIYLEENVEIREFFNSKNYVPEISMFKLLARIRRP